MAPTNRLAPPAELEPLEATEPAPTAGNVDRLLSASRLSATMPWILGVMVFLATLAGGAALSGARAAVSLRSALDDRLVVQVVEGDPATRSAVAVRALARLQEDPAVASAQLVPEAEVRRLVGPYLGTDRLDASLPVPALIDVTLTRSSPAEVERLATALSRIARSVRLDRSAEWAAPVRRFLTLAATLALAVLGLAVAAMTAAVVLAARAALDAHRATIATLHLLGATDRQVSRLFERRVGRDGVPGVWGGWALGAALFLLIAGWIAGLGVDVGGGVDPSGGEGAAGGGGGIGLVHPTGRWLVAAATVAVPLGAMGLSRLSTRLTVRGALRSMR